MPRSGAGAPAAYVSAVDDDVVWLHVAVHEASPVQLVLPRATCSIKTTLRRRPPPWAID
jgi:hypothetical protein